MKMTRGTLLNLALLLGFAVSGCRPLVKTAQPTTSADATSQYLANLDIEKIMNSGSDYASLVITQGDANSFVNALVEKYKDIDRKRVLEAIFLRLTKNVKDETEREKAILYFVQKLSAHDFNSPFMGIPVFDPIILFDIHSMDCQKDSRMIADLYAAAGYESRLVDLYGHMVAEVKYDGGWHYADADMFGGGQIVTMPDGHIPSMAELSTHYELLDQLQVYLENEVLFSYENSGNKGGRSDIPWNYPSYAYFSKTYFDKNPGFPYYVYKANQTPTTDMFNGWDESKGDVRREHATDIELSDIREINTPKPPSITNILVTNKSIKVTFTERTQSDIIGYKIFISKQSRGWDYGSFNGDPAAKMYWANPDGWKPAMYDALFQQPPGDVEVLESNQPEFIIDHLPQGRFYLSIMAIDRYGESIGKKLYPLSNEILVEIG